MPNQMEYLRLLFLLIWFLTINDALEMTKGKCIAYFPDCNALKKYLL